MIQRDTCTNRLPANKTTTITQLISPGSTETRGKQRVHQEVDQRITSDGTDTIQCRLRTGLDQLDKLGDTGSSNTGDLFEGRVADLRGATKGLKALSVRLGLIRKDLLDSVLVGLLGFDKANHRPLMDVSEFTQVPSSHAADKDEQPCGDGEDVAEHHRYMMLEVEMRPDWRDNLRRWSTAARKAGSWPYFGLMTSAIHSDSD